MRVCEMPVAGLKPYDKNAKVHSQGQVDDVAESIRRYGWQQPIVVDRYGVVVIGHCRLLAAKKLGLKDVPCVVADDLTDEELRELRIADNKLNESPWDYELLAEECEGLDLDAFNFEIEQPGGRMREISESVEYRVEALLNEEYGFECPECGFRFNA